MFWVVFRMREPNTIGQQYGNGTPQTIAIQFIDTPEESEEKSWAKKIEPKYFIGNFRWQLKQ